MRALVTGVSRGIGRSICIRLAQDALARGEQPHIGRCCRRYGVVETTGMDSLPAVGMEFQRATAFLISGCVLLTLNRHLDLYKAGTDRLQLLP